jgi:hypothetical protein
MALQLYVQDRRGQSMGAGILMAAQGIAQGMEKYYQRKEEAKQIDYATSSFIKATEKNPFLAQALNIDTKDPAAVKTAIKAAGGYKEFLSAASGMNNLIMQQKAQEQQQLIFQQEQQARQAMMNAANGNATRAQQMARGARFQDLQVGAGQANPGQFMQQALAGGANPKDVATAGNAMTNAQQFEPEVITLPNGQQVIRTSPNSVQTTSGDYAGEGPMMDANGQYIGNATLDKKANKRWLLRPGGEKTEIPAGAQPVTATGLAKGIPQVNDFKKMSSDVTDAEISIRNMDRYMKSVKDANVGLQSLADKFSAGAKTLLDSGEWTPKELALKLSEGQLQGLLGANRTNVVGGGVMTEQDAIRIITRLGGDAGALRNPQLVRAAIAQVYADRYRQYENDIGFYNAAVDQYYGERGFKSKKPIEFNADFAKSLQDMGDPAAPGSGGNIDAILNKYK